MASKPGKSRWADTEEDAAYEAELKKQREEKKRQKAEKARIQQERKQKEAKDAEEELTEHEDRPPKRRRVTPEPNAAETVAERKLLKVSLSNWAPCRSDRNYQKLNDIEEGAYGFVSRARDTATSRIVALKRLKTDENDRNGFPVTAMREIKILRACDHRNVVKLLETVVSPLSAPPSVSLVLEFVEHDLRGVLEDMTETFLPSEIKRLMLQLASGLAYIHDHYIIHRDLKTSNLLLNNKGQLKIADFGMARYTSDPPPDNLTTLVVTLWYRSPELLLGAKTYTAAIDMWSVGCIFAELLERKPLFAGSAEAEQISKIFEVVGLPSDETWPGFRRLPNAKVLKLPRKPGPVEDRIRPRFTDLTKAGCSLMRDLLSLNPEARPTAKEMLQHPYFAESPKPKAEALFPTFPSKANQERRPRREPHAPARGERAAELGEVDVSHLFGSRDSEAKGAGFRLKMG
ncbi:hypothetical protein jhhlp_002048 [Lomentospora prolificans]|uniref:cyclin-dependent kinase n=1 Tax=Lomentospora prolificans TaxID=41688 RepID=A0A2N3ND07_9PEZI|nr:hypothetical protein jhhlp_002048 [Lomentospora prolificans]